MLQVFEFFPKKQSPLIHAAGFGYLCKLVYFISTTSI